MRERAIWKPDAAWIVGAEQGGRPVARVFVRDDAARCLRLDRVVQRRSDGYYAAYRPRADAPFLVAEDLDDAIGRWP